MIITRLRGGLGNQMFQYALGRILCTIRNETLKLDITGYAENIQGDTPRAYRLGFFNIQAEIATPEEVHRAKYPFGFFSKLIRAYNQKILKRHNVDYEPSLLKQKHIPYLDGFFQSEKYYFTTALKELLRNDFILKDEYISSSMKVLSEKIKFSDQISVSLHIRRGDYVTNASANKTQGLCSMEYYEKAVQKMYAELQDRHGKEIRLSFYIFSDDIDWVTENLKISAYCPESTTTYISNPNLADYEELTLMSYCNHNIIANSSFSWWGAWLNKNPNKIVIAPKQWTVKNSEHPNIIPEDWIRV